MEQILLHDFLDTQWAGYLVIAIIANFEIFNDHCDRNDH
jgi:hypothetical protein